MPFGLHEAEGLFRGSSPTGFGAVLQTSIEMVLETEVGRNGNSVCLPVWAINL